MCSRAHVNPHRAYLYLVPLQKGKRTRRGKVGLLGDPGVILTNKINNTLSAMTQKALLMAVFALWPLLGIATPSGQTLGVAHTSTSDARAKTLVVGRVAKDPRHHLPRMQKLADYLASHLGEFGITTGGVEVAKTNAQMIQYLRYGMVDVVSETPLSACRFAEETEAEILLRGWKGGAALYSSVFFARKDSPIFSFSDLQGNTIAFEDSGSTSAFLLPFATLKRDHFELLALSSPKLIPPKDTVGYVFAGGEFAIAVYVHRGLAAAGAFSNLDWIDLGNTNPQLRKDLRIFHTTEPVIRSLVLVRRELKTSIKRALATIFLNMEHDPNAQDVLKNYYDTKKYDRITGEVKQQLDDVRAIYRFVHDHLK